MRRIAMPDEGIGDATDHSTKPAKPGSALSVRLKTIGHEVVIEAGRAKSRAPSAVFGQLAGLLRDGYRFGRGDVKTAAQLVANNPNVEPQEYFLKGSARTAAAKQVTPKSVTQRRHLDARSTSSTSCSA